MHICIIGAGVIGVTSAMRLLEAGHEVTIVDAMSEVATKTSLGNGSQLAYSYVTPLAEPSIWTQWPVYLFSPASPFMLRPQADLGQWRWLLRFLIACNAGRARKSTIELLKIAFFSREKLAELRARIPIDFLYRQSGKLVMLGDAAKMKAARAQVEFQAGLGCEQEVFDLDRCIAVDPALASSGRRWIGGVYTESEEVGDCAMFCSGLLAEMLKRPGFRFAHSSKVTRFNLHNKELHSIEAGGETLIADAFVLAAGAESMSLAVQVGLSLPIYPLKGYSITVPILSPDHAPNVSVTDQPRKIVYARVGGNLRVAGRLEMVGMDRGIPDRVINELKQAVLETFPGCGDLTDNATLSPWAGLRPATPQGLPIIGASPIKNLFLNVGHGSLGWTLACGSAALLADLIDDLKPEIDPLPFQFKR